MAFRPVRSDIDDQKKRPPMLNRLSRPAKPPPTVALTPNMSWHISEAWPRMPMPAVTFRQRTIQKSQNGGVFQATLDGNVCVSDELPGRGPAECNPSGRHPWAGTRTVKAPKVMKTKYTQPITRSASFTPTEVADLNPFISSTPAAPRRGHRRQSP